MTKVVYSPRYGGYGLSKAAQMEMFKRKGVIAYPLKSRMSFYRYFDAEPPKDVRGYYQSNTDSHILEVSDWINKHSLKEDYARHDPDLVAVVEELGSEKASANYARLAIWEIVGDRYIINEYNGNESVIEPEDMNWVVIKCGN